MTEGRRSINRLANQWYNEVRQQASSSEDEEDELEMDVVVDADDEQVLFEANGPLMTSQSTSLRSPTRDVTIPKTRLGT